MHACILVCVCGISSHNLPVVIPGYLAMAMLKVRCGTVGVASHPVRCTSLDVQNPSASKSEKVKFTLKKKPSTLPSDSSEFFHAKFRTRIGCWNVCSLGSLSDQSA